LLLLKRRERKRKEEGREGMMGRRRKKRIDTTYEYRWLGAWMVGFLIGVAGEEK
jgi:hypothetical protein